MKGLGVTINLSKSVLGSTNSFEFAKVSVVKGHIVSPISWKMFTSQNSLIGRVNILFQLLNKKIYKNPSMFSKNVLRYSIDRLGAYNLNLVALLSMYVTSKKMSYTSLMNLLIVPVSNWDRRIGRSADYLDTKFAEKTLTMILRGEEELPRRNSKLMTIISQLDLPWHKIQLSNRLLMYKAKSGDIEGRIVIMTNRIVDTLLPGVIPEHLKVISFTNSEDFQSSDLEFVTLYTMFHKIVQNLVGEYSFLDVVNRHTYGFSIDTLIGLNGQIDRLEEVFQLVDRAINPDLLSKKNRIIKGSPIKALEFIIKSNKRRPLWTKQTLEDSYPTSFGRPTIVD